MVFHRVSDIGNVHTRSLQRDQFLEMQKSFIEEEQQKNSHQAQADEFQWQSWAKFLPAIGGIAAGVFVNQQESIKLAVNGIDGIFEHSMQGRVNILKHKGDVAERMISQLLQQKNRSAQNHDEIRTMVRQALEALAQAFKRQ